MVAPSPYLRLTIRTVHMLNGSSGDGAAVCRRIVWSSTTSICLIGFTAKLKLDGLLRTVGMRAKVNLIAWNPGPEVAFTMPRAEDVARFQERLREQGVPAVVRRPRGRDIYAACGQLKRTSR